jgi:hypothetical protein
VAVAFTAALAAVAAGTGPPELAVTSGDASVAGVAVERGREAGTDDTDNLSSL